MDDGFDHLDSGNGAQGISPEPGMASMMGRIAGATTMNPFAEALQLESNASRHSGHATTDHRMDRSTPSDVATNFLLKPLSARHIERNLYSQGTGDYGQSAPQHLPYAGGLSQSHGVTSAGLDSTYGFYDLQQPQLRPGMHLLSRSNTLSNVSSPVTYDLPQFPETSAVFGSAPFLLGTEDLRPYSGYNSHAQSLVSPDPTANRRRRHQTREHIRHRRTRSGCLTCRNRRIKCDEAHPTCDRCKKGSRECTWPERSKSKHGKSTEANLDSISHSSSDEQDSNDDGRLPAIHDEVEAVAVDGDDKLRHSNQISSNSEAISPSTQQRSSPTTISRTTNSTNSQGRALDASRAPPSSNASTTSRHRPLAAYLSSPKWSVIPKDVQAQIKYHIDHITYHHYIWKHDSTNFLKTTFVDIALNYNPLLYAISAFAAYFHALAKPDGDIKPAMNYYNKSLALLRDSLEKNANVGSATMLTMLQLAIFEEHMGDWAFASFHQAAVHLLMTRNFSAEDVMKDETSRRVIDWYSRFDVAIASIANSETALGKQWQAANLSYYQQRRDDNPDNVQIVFEEFVCRCRHLAADVAGVFGKRDRSGLPDAEYKQRIGELKLRFEEYGAQIEAIVGNPQNTHITSFPHAPASEDSRTIFDWREPNLLVGGDLKMWNVIVMDWHAIHLLFMGQMYQHDSLSVDPADMARAAHRMCQIFEALKYAEGCTADVIGAHADLGIAMTALPKDKETIDWCARQMAHVSRAGYVYPASFRERMSSLWDRDVTHWWLPHDELLTPMVGEIMSFVQDRYLRPDDETACNLRSLSAVFEVMTLTPPSTVGQGQGYGQSPV